MTPMTKSLETKLQRYNNLIDKLDSLRYHIEKELSEKYDIDDLRKGFRTDEPFGLKECCSNRYDIDKIKQIINAMIEFEKQTGETPEYIDLVHMFDINDD